MIPEHVKIIAALAAYRKGSNYGPDFSDDVTQKFWISKLGEIPLQSIHTALNSLSGDREFPTVNAVIERASGFNPGDARKAFDWVWSHLDGYQAPRDLPILTARTIEELGGWFTISRDWRLSRQEFHAREFVRAYKELAASRARGEFIGGSRLALESPESKKEGLGIPRLPEWKKRHIESLEKDLLKKQANSPKSGLSFSEQVQDLIGRSNYRPTV